MTPGEQHAANLAVLARLEALAPVLPLRWDGWACSDNDEALLDGTQHRLLLAGGAGVDAHGAAIVALLTAAVDSIAPRRELLTRHAPSVFMGRARCGYCLDARGDVVDVIDWPCVDYTAAAAGLDHLTTGETE